MDINKEELISHLNDDNYITKVAQRYFKYYDKNVNSLIEKNELLEVMTDIAKTFYNMLPEKSAVEEQFQKLDLDKNNGIDFNEFKSFIHEYLKMLIEF